MGAALFLSTRYMGRIVERVEKNNIVNKNKVEGKGDNKDD